MVIPSRARTGRLRRLLSAACLALICAVAPRLVRAQTPVLEPPQITEAVAPDYPPKAEPERIRAEVGLELYIDENGELVKAVVVQPADVDGIDFDAIAVETVERFEFEPATRDGTPIPAKVRYTMRFEPPPLPQAFYDNAFAAGEALEITLEQKTQPLIERVRAAWQALQPPPPLSIEGTVIERGTRVPLAGVLVTLQAPDGGEIREIYTDEEGRFEARGLEPGDWTVVIEETEYGRYETEERVSEGEVVEVDYYIERRYYDEYGTDGAYVYETRETKLRKEVNRRTLDVAEITKIPGNTGDALKVVQNLPGVARSTFNSGQIIVRGSAPEDTEVLLDGTPIPLLYHFGGLTSVVPSEILSSIDFFPGNFSARYGRAMGGVLDVKTRPPRRDRWSGYLDVDVIDAGFFIEGPVHEDVSVQASARRSYFDALLPLVLPDDIGGELTVAPRYWDYQGRVNWRVAPGHELEAFSYGSDDVLEFLLDEPAADAPFVRGNIEAGTAFHRGQFSYNYEGDRMRNKLVYNTGTTTIDFGIGDEIRFVLDIFAHNIREELELDVTDTVTLITGFDILIGDFGINVRLPDQRREGEFAGGFETRRFIELTQEGAIYQPAWFVEGEIQVLPQLLLILGGRVDYTKLSDAFHADVRSALRYSVLDDLTLKAGMGTFSQPPQPQETADVVGNPNLAWEKSTHYAVGAEYRMPFYEPLFVDLTGFYKTFDDLVASSDDPVVRDGELVTENFDNDGVGRAYGMELLVRHDLANNFFGWIAYTLSQAQRADGPGQRLYPFDFDQRHIFTILGSYKLPQQWQVGLRWRYVSGTPFTPEEGAVFDADAGSFEELDGRTNSARIEDFHQLDLRVDKSFVFDAWILGIYLDIQNVYYHANAEAVQYNYDSTERGFIRGLPILPSFGIKGSF